MKNKKGISLITLTVTILVISILAAASIYFLEDSGIIPASKDVTKASNLEQVQELVRVAWLKAGANGNATLAELQVAVDDALTKSDIDKTKYNVIVTESDVRVSYDFKAPIISSTSLEYTDKTVTVNVSVGSVTTEDYPLTVEYYIKKAAASDNAYFFAKETTLASTKTDTYTYSNLTSGAAYTIKVIARDKNGNPAEKLLNVTTQ